MTEAQEAALGAAMLKLARKERQKNRLPAETNTEAFRKKVRNRIDDDTRRQLVEAYERLNSYKAVARVFKMSENTVSRAIKKRPFVRAGKKETAT